MSEVQWHIGKEANPLDRPPYRAYFFLIEDHMLSETWDYDAAELTGELNRRRKDDELLEPFELALEVLVRANA